MGVQAIDIGVHRIGPDLPCFIIAEAGVNHNGDVAMARRLVDVAVQAGANAVKFQTFKAEKVISPEAPKASYQLQATGSGESQLDMAKHLELSFESFRGLWRYCQEKRITFLSTAFDEESADFLEELGVTAFKIPSGEITNLPFLRYLARKRKPLIVSTGMSYLGEVETAVRTIREIGHRELVLLHCVSDYPAKPRDANLRAMHVLAAAFGVPVGFSDHTPGLEVGLAAVALGACVIEKHFTLDRSLPGPDHRASLEPAELAALVQSIRGVQEALGHGRKEPATSEADTAAVARRSLVARRDVLAGAVLSERDVAVLRPGTGLPAAMLPHVLGRKARVKIAAGTLLTLEMLA